MAKLNEACWNPEMETVAPDRLRETEEEKLRRQLEYTWQLSPFYRRKWEEAGVDPRRVRRVEDLARLPFTEKRELQETQEASPPLGANRCAPLDQLVRMQATGGTTGRPLRMAMTRHDVAVYNEVGARAAWAAGLRPADVLFECMNYGFYAGGVSDHMTFETVGACVVPAGVGQSKRVIEIIRDMRIPVCLWSTPSYALHLADVVRDGGLEPATLGIRKGFFSGDAGLAIPGYRAQIEGTWNLLARDIWGLGELGSLAAECRYAEGLHYVGQGLFLAEFIDPDSGEPAPMVEGAVGELVVTTIDREAHPLIRFRTHDHVRLCLEPCPCGRTGFRVRVLGRGDDMFIVRGVNVYPLGVQDVIFGFRPELTGEFQILLQDPPPIAKEPVLRVEYGQGVPIDELGGLRARLVRRIRDLLVFTPAVELVPPGSLPRSERKAKRLYRLYEGEQP
ncbi:MAG: phenylacetate--CoA ligase family protein [Candidatus Rokubacteria bacterium]|nr:phenylacetate--CoA ligase family protein [Candidatus Rokubacteria bacterium]